MSSRLWLWGSLGFMVFGVPLIACGGQVLSGATDAGVAEAGSPTHTGSSTGTTPTGTTTTTPPSSGTSTGTATSTPTGTGSGPGPGGFGPFPCTAYTAIYNTCPPSTAASGSASPPDCQYWAQNGEIGLSTPPGEVAGPGCKIEVVPPTSTGGATCDHVDCVCTNGTWQHEPGSSSFPCPQ